MISKVKMRPHAEICQLTEICRYLVASRFVTMLRSGIILTTAMSANLDIQRASIAHFVSLF